MNNIFVLFICITSKIPLFIVGKPGYSKTLSAQLLFKSMKGQDSDSLFFQKFPKLYIHSYQGSLSSTPKGIMDTFKAARDKIKLKKQNEGISIVFFDELGLAQKSPYSPLEVLNSELEYDLEEAKNRVSFVGISNYKLDSSKMNRGIMIQIPELDEDILIKTSVIIAESIIKPLPSEYRVIITDLAKTFYQYKEELKDKPEKKEFHGIRDFYNLIKIAVQNLSNKNNNIEISKQKAAEISIERNLSGLEFNDEKETSVKMVKKIFQNFYNDIKASNEYPIRERIEENIEELNNRYLLLVTNTNTSEYLIYSSLEKKFNDKEIISYFGSKFKEDQNSENYTLKIIDKIHNQIDKNVILILKNLENIYPALYSLFNQNFTNVGGRNYARLAVGSYNTYSSLVNDKFKCIILVDKEQIQKEESPFLNRFEKHIINYKYLLNKTKYEKFTNIKKDLVEKKLVDNKQLNYDISKLFNKL